MPRPINHRSKLANCARWRETIGMTERQAEVVVGLMSAQLLGYDGATAEELASIGVNREAAYRAGELQRLGLIELVGHTFERHPRKVWRVTAVAWRRMGVVPPAAVPPRERD